MTGSVTCYKQTLNRSLRNEYYKECFRVGITKSDAVNAEVECKRLYNDWWKGNRFSQSKPALIQEDHIDDDGMDDDNDVHMSGMERKPQEEKVQYPYFSPQDSSLKAVKNAITVILKEEQDLKPQQNPRFLHLLEVLRSSYKTSSVDARFEKNCNDKTWLTFPTSYHESLGKNRDGDHKYTLGRMSFDMFRPTDLVCSIQWTFNTVMSLNGKQFDKNLRPVPSCCLPGGVLHGKENLLRQYDISTAFTVESKDSNSTEPVRGLMTTFGYILPHPSVPNRFLVWFTGGILEEVIGKHHTSRPSENWKNIFHESRCGRSLKSHAQLVAAGIFLGARVSDRMDKYDGSMEYFFHRPIGGDGKQFVDILYLDDDFRIMQGHHGTIYVSTRMTESHLNP